MAGEIKVMNRLQKNAWFGLGVAVMVAMISAIFIKSMTASNAGGKIYYLPAVFWCCILTAQVVYSAVILFQCRQEQSDE
jgi:hypothetical protein